MGFLPEQFKCIFLLWGIARLVRLIGRRVGRRGVRHPRPALASGCSRNELPPGALGCVVSWATEPDLANGTDLLAWLDIGDRRMLRRVRRTSGTGHAASDLVRRVAAGGPGPVGPPGGDAGERRREPCALAADGRPEAGLRSVRVIVISDIAIGSIDLSVDGRDRVIKPPMSGAAGMWQSRAARGGQSRVAGWVVQVRLDDATGEPGGPGYGPPARRWGGTDANTIGAARFGIWFGAFCSGQAW